MKRNFGCIIILEDLVRNAPDFVAEVFYKMKFLPMQIEEVWESRRYIYKGYSELFYKVEEGARMPFYDATVSLNEEGELLSFHLSEPYYPYLEPAFIFGNHGLKSTLVDAETEQRMAEEKYIDELKGLLERKEDK